MLNHSKLYDIIKRRQHEAEGAYILQDIFADMDEEFRLVTQNASHDHHERFGGTGCLAEKTGDESPLEARIMAIAGPDVQVSKRGYKDRGSLRDANRIIPDGMSSQFDPKLRKYYGAAHSKLEGFHTYEGEENS